MADEGTGDRGSCLLFFVAFDSLSHDRHSNTAAASIVWRTSSAMQKEKWAPEDAHA
jgi:hypothetical protein